jgi:hypothetical protein
MKLTGDQITALADFADGADCQVSTPVKGTMAGEPRSYVPVTRIEDKERVRIYDDGGVERVSPLARPDTTKPAKNRPEFCRAAEGDRCLSPDCQCADTPSFRAAE